MNNENIFKTLLGEGESLCRKYNFYKKNDNYDNMKVNKINYFVNQSKNKKLVDSYKSIVECFELELHEFRNNKSYTNSDILNLSVSIRYFMQNMISFLFTNQTEIKRSIQVDKVSILLEKYIQERLGAESFIIDFDDCVFGAMDDYAEWKITQNKFMEE